MQGFIDIHTHNKFSKDAIINFYEDFDQHNNVRYCSLGLHPWYLENAAQDFEKLQQFAMQKNVVAIGECGLDKLSATDLSLQESYFKRQIDLAIQLQKPLIIHCVRAFNECLAMLHNVTVPVIFHGFNRNSNIAQMLLKQGFYLSIGKAIFQPSFEAVFADLPVENIFFETDDQVHSSIETSYKRAAETKNIPLESLILQVENNFQKVFIDGR